MLVDANALLNVLQPRCWQSEDVAKRNGLLLVGRARARRLKSGLISVSLVWRNPDSVMTVFQSVWVRRDQVKLIRKPKSTQKRGALRW